MGSRRRGVCGLDVGVEGAGVDVAEDDEGVRTKLSVDKPDVSTVGVSADVLF